MQRPMLAAARRAKDAALAARVIARARRNHPGRLAPISPAGALDPGEDAGPRRRGAERSQPGGVPAVLPERAHVAQPRAPSDRSSAGIAVHLALQETAGAGAARRPGAGARPGVPAAVQRPAPIPRRARRWIACCTLLGRLRTADRDHVRAAPDPRTGAGRDLRRHRHVGQHRPPPPAPPATRIGILVSADPALAAYVEAGRRRR